MTRNRSYVVLGVLLLCIAISGAAQEFEYLVTGGGPSFGTFMPDLTEINGFVSGLGFAPFEDSLLLIGGKGGVGFIPGPTIGGGGWGAWGTSTQGELEAEYGIGLGGIELGYGIGASENGAVTVGFLAGGGGADLTLTGNLSIPPPVPLGIVPTPTEQVYNSVFFVLSPYADIQINLLDYAGINIRAGYVWLPFSYSWHDSELPDPPHLALDGLYVHFTVVFGGIFDISEDEEQAAQD